MQVASENFLGTSHIRAMEEEVSKKVDAFVGMLHHSAEECDEEGVIYAFIVPLKSLLDENCMYDGKRAEVIIQKIITTFVRPNTVCTRTFFGEEFL